MEIVSSTKYTMSAYQFCMKEELHESKVDKVRSSMALPVIARHINSFGFHMKNLAMALLSSIKSTGFVT